jgi:predicted transcriptional regulator
MSETLSIRINSKTKQRLDALAQRSRRSKSFLAAEAVLAYVDSQAWQFEEIEKGMADIQAGQTVSHEKVAGWLQTWGKKGETKAPR